VRFIDAGGARIHYSTWQPDVLRQDDASISYRGYTAATDFIPYDEVAAADRGRPRGIPDQTGERLLFSFPFYDSYDVFRGTALFSLSARAVSERLIGEGRIKAGEALTVVSTPGGLLMGMPAQEGRAVIAEVSTIWLEGIFSLTRLFSTESNTVLALISARTAQGLLLGRLVNEAVFAFPPAMQAILLASFFLTVYLVIFLCFNVRQDSVAVVQNRLKRLQVSLIEQYYEGKNDLDWSRWTRELEQRRDEMRLELKKGLKIDAAGEGDIDRLIDKSWDELLAFMGGRTGALMNEEKLHAVLSRMLTAPRAAAPVPPAVVTTADVEDAEVEDIDGIEELEELGEADEITLVEELAPADEVEAELVEEVNDAEPVKKPAAKADGEGQKPTNVKLVFGEDDIPYVVESSGIELEGEDIDKLIKDMATDADEGEELEELEELEEEPDSADEGDSSEVQGDAGFNLAAYASEIEFSAAPAETNEEEASLVEDLEVVSPFADMLSDLAAEEETPADTAPGGAEEIELLEELPEADDAPDGDDKKKTLKL
jgi:hypothetical protein